MKTKKNDRRSAWQAFGMALMAILAMSPSLALAAPDFFTGSIVPGDKSVEALLKPIFGELFGGSATTGFAKTIQIFNAACMTVGGVLAAYTIVFGTMSTAHDGEMLGKKWSSAWVPIRTALGVGLVAPLGSGFCVAQMIIAWVSLQGVGLADSLWTTYINNAVTPAGMAPVTTMPKTREMAVSMLTSLTCVAKGNDLASKNPGIYGGQSFGVVPQPNDKGRMYGLPSSPSLCGGMNYESINTGVNAAMVQVGNMASINRIAINSTLAEKESAQQQLRDAHRTAAIQMEARLMPLAKKIANNGTVGEAASNADMAVLEAAANEYQLSIGTAAGSLFGGANALQSIKESATQDGWIMAGSWFMRAAQLQDTVNQAASSTPSMVPPSNTPDGDDPNEAFEPAYTALSGLLANSSGAYGLDPRAPKQDNGNVKDTSTPWYKFDFSAMAKSKIFNPAAEWMAKHITPDPNRHPMMELKSLGDNLMGLSELVILGGIGVSFFSAASGSILLMLGGTIFVFASMISVYYPILPFIIYFGTALGWLLLVAESIIAAPLVAVMKLAPGGDDVMGNSRPAYMLILGLLLRPALIVLGFIVSLVAVEFVVRLLNQVFFPMFFASMGTSLVGFVTFIVGLGVFFTVMTTLLHKLFGLTHIIPDQILRWIGGGGESLGNTAGQLSQESKSNVIAAAGNFRQGSQQVQSAANNQRIDRSQKAGNQQGAASMASSHKGELAGLNKKKREAETAANRPGATAEDKLDAADAHYALAQRHSLVADSLKSAGPKYEKEMGEHQKAAQTHLAEFDRFTAEAKSAPPRAGGGGGGGSGGSGGDDGKA